MSCKKCIILARHQICFFLIVIIAASRTCNLFWVSYLSNKSLSYQWVASILNDCTFFKSHTKWSIAQRVSAPTITILPTPVRIFPQLELFQSHSIFTATKKWISYISAIYWKSDISLKMLLTDQQSVNKNQWHQNDTPANKDVL